MVKFIKDSISYYTRHNFLFFRQIEQITSLENLDASEIRKLEEKEAMKMIRFAVGKSPFYARLYEKINLKGSFEDVYNQLPVITKADIRSNEMDIVTDPVSMVKKAHTSGTSGSPLAIFRSAGSILKENAYLWQYRISNGVNPGDRVISMRGVLDNNKLDYYNKAENTLYLSSYLLSSANIRKYAQLIKKFKPKAIFAFPSSLFTLSNLLEQAQFHVKVPVLFTSSETLYPFQREKIEQVLQAKIYDLYGTAERTAMLQQCFHGNYHKPPKYSLTDFKESGVLTTGFINKAFPLIKYQIDDTFRLMDQPCACGKGVGIAAVEGRVDDAVILEDGTRIGRLGVAFQGIPNLRFAQIIQDNKETINVNIVTTSAFGNTDQQLLEKKLRKRLNGSIRIRFNKVAENDIIKTRSGKFKLVISKVP